MKRQNATQQKPRLFQLVRHTDVSGVRGTGTLADGVEWPDGAVILRWRGRWPVTSVWEGGLDALLAVHGQGGRTQVHWLPAVRQAGLSPPVPVAPARIVASAGGAGVRSTEQGGALWLPAAGADGLCVRCGRGWPCLGCGP